MFPETPTPPARPSWMDAPVAVSASILQDMQERAKALPGEFFPLSRKELLLFLATVRDDRGSM